MNLKYHNIPDFELSLETTYRSWLHGFRVDLFALLLPWLLLTFASTV